MVQQTQKFALALETSDHDHVKRRTLQSSTTSLIEQAIKSGDLTHIESQLAKMPKDKDMSVAIGFSEIAQCEFNALEKFLLHAEQQGLITEAYQLDAADRFHLAHATKN